LGREANAKVVDILSKEYGLYRAEVFKDVALADARKSFNLKRSMRCLLWSPRLKNNCRSYAVFFNRARKRYLSWSIRRRRSLRPHVLMKASMYQRARCAELLLSRTMIWQSWGVRRAMAQL